MYPNASEILKLFEPTLVITKPKKTGFSQVIAYIKYIFKKTQNKY